MKRETGWILILCIGLDMTKADIIKGEAQSWYEAQRHCQQMGGHLSYNRSQENSYWTPYYKRLSLWIKMIGCYKSADINRTYGISMRIPSVGMCQELCFEKNVLTFAVRHSSCVCSPVELKSRLPSLKPANCSYKCSKHTEGLTYHECGGPSAYNVYVTGNTSEKSKETKETKCMSVQCGQPKYLPRRCNETHIGLCQSNNVELDPGNATSWRKSLDTCKSSSLSSYLLGNLSLLDANLPCKILNESKLGSMWIGDAKQTYISFDNGQNIEEKNMVKCQKCTKVQGCPYVNCARKVKFMCDNVRTSTDKFRFSKKTKNPKDISSKGVTKWSNAYTDALSISTSTKRTSAITPMTSRPSTQSNVNMETKSLGKDNITTSVIQLSRAYTDVTSISISTKRTSDMETKSQGYPDTDKETRFNILIALSITLPILLAVTILVTVIFIRRRRHDRQKKNVHVEEQHKDDFNHYSQVDKSKNKNHFLLEPQPPKNSKDPSDVEQLMSENPYSVKEEGVYDHLGESDSRRKAEEDTYDHTGFVLGRGDCDYDTTQSIKRQEQEDTYDLAGPISFDVETVDHP